MENNNKMRSEKDGIDFQSFLSIGYLYLVFLGIINETLYYNQFDLNILYYSNILDVLITPIAQITSSKFDLFFIVLLIILVWIIPPALVKRRKKKWLQKSFMSAKEDYNDKELTKKLYQLFMFLAAVMVSGFFTGSGFKKGQKIVRKAEINELEYLDRILYLDDKEANVKIIGKNSSFIFYLEEGEKLIHVSPIAGTIKRITEN